MSPGGAGLIVTAVALLLCLRRRGATLSSGEQRQEQNEILAGMELHREDLL
ncbi:MAG: hypothetical protein ABIS50_11475 [Luteolibacter sp.]|uniref:hypothetical protein n=1 Tax=Luteolibacter sp. TaxID=1962973 RepID=UPI003266267B